MKQSGSKQPKGTGCHHEKHRDAWEGWVAKSSCGLGRLLVAEGPTVACQEPCGLAAGVEAK